MIWRRGDITCKVVMRNARPRDFNTGILAIFSLALFSLVVPLTMANELLAEIEFEQSPIPSNQPDLGQRFPFLRSGCIWRIRKNDEEPFPSNPHAHNLESGLRMDLSSGSLFFEESNTGKKVSKTHLEFIRQRAEMLNIPLPPLGEMSAVSEA